VRYAVRLSEPRWFFCDKITCRKKKDAHGSHGPLGGSVHASTHLPVLTQIEMVFYKNSFGGSLKTYSSGFWKKFRRWWGLTMKDNSVLFGTAQTSAHLVPSPRWLTAISPHLSLSLPPLPNLVDGRRHPETIARCAACAAGVTSPVRLFWGHLSSRAGFVRFRDTRDTWDTCNYNYANLCWPMLSG